MDRPNKYSRLVLQILSVVSIAAAVYIFVLYQVGKHNITVSNQSQSYLQAAKQYYDQAAQVAPSENLKNLAEEITPMIENILHADVKLSESNDEKIVYVAKTIIVEGDVDNMKNSLESAGYSNVKISDHFKKITTEKDGRRMTLDFSVDTLERGRIVLTL